MYSVPQFMYLFKNYYYLYYRYLYKNVIQRSRIFIGKTTMSFSVLETCLAIWDEQINVNCNYLDNLNRTLTISKGDGDFQTVCIALVRKIVK